VLLLGLSGCQFYDKLQARDQLNKGVQAYTSKQYKSAAEHFQTAIEKDPTLIDAYLYLATTLRAEFVPLVTTPDNLRRGMESIRAFEEVLKLDANNVNAMANIADLYRNMEKPDEAKEWYRKLMTIEAQKAQALYGIASLDYNMANELTGKDGENIPNLTPEKKEEVSRMVDEGIATLRQALELNKRFSEAMEYLNLLYREKAELAENDEEKRQWEREADKLALEAMELKRQLQREAEAARRQMFRTEEQKAE
jgi:tetratricopeptide (TPR) repeat protein